MRIGRKLIVKCKRSLAESCNEVGTMPEFFSVILCWKRYYTSEMSNTQLIVSSLMEVLAELMVCRSIIFVTTLTRTGNPCDRIFSLALTAHKLFGSRDSQSQWRQAYAGYPHGHRPCYPAKHLPMAWVKV